MVGIRKSYIDSLRKIICINKQINNLAPSSTQVDQLMELNYQYIKKTTVPFNKNKQTWFDNFIQSTNSPHPLFFGKFSTGIQQNQKKRSEHVITMMEKHNKTNLVTMDGHGRLVWSIINVLSLHNISIKKFQFIIVDIDENVTKWHNNFLPKDITSYTNNILNTCFSKKLNKNNYFYFNFCGTYGQRYEIIHRVKYLINENMPFTISFSTRGKKQNFTKAGLITNNGMKNILLDLGCKEICKYSHMITLYYE